MTTFRFKLVALALAAALAGCGDGRDAPAPEPSPSIAPTPEANTAAGGRLGAAVSAAFPDGETVESENGERYVFTNHRLVDAPFGLVLVSEGQAQDAAHVSAGRLDISYLTPNGADFLVAEQFPAAVRNGSFGQMSDWSVRSDLADVPTVQAEGGFTGQGYSCGSAVLTELRADGPLEVAVVPLVYDNTGAVSGADAQSFEGTIANATPRSFDVRFTGTRSFTERYVRQGGKWVREGPAQLPTC